MLSKILVIILSLSTGSSDALKNVTECPNVCNCDLTSSNTSFTVDCGYHLPDADAKRMSRILNSMLSTDHIAERLTSLTITKTPLSRVPASVCRLLNLNRLQLDDNKLVELPDNCFTKLTKLTTVSMNRNSIVGLQNGLFDGLQNLVTLDLERNQIASIGLRLFSNSSDLTSLRRLNLAYNKLTSLEPWWYFRCVLGTKSSPVTVSLAYNMIANFTNQLQIDFRCGMKPAYGLLDLSQNRIVHVADIYNGWGMGSKESLCLEHRRRQSHADMTIRYGGTYYACDCMDFYFYRLSRFFTNGHALNDVRCRSYSLNATEPVYANTIPLNEFVCKLSDRCPSSCRCVYRPANITLHIYCSRSNSSLLPLDLPPLPKRYVRYKLDFSHSIPLRRLEHRPYFVNTSVLDVSNCGLTEISLEVWKDVALMKAVNFRRNMVQSLPRRADTINISASLLLGGNPWKCSCDNSWMIGYLRSLSDHIADPGDIICQSPSRMYGRNVLKSSEEEFCVDPVNRALTISLSTVGLACVVLILTPVLIYKLRVRFYKTLNIHPFDRDECLGEDMLFDVFLCCSSEDYDPHGRTILQLLESENYRVCSHYRDFQAGLIMDNIDRALMRSKRTLCLLSNNFLQRWTTYFQIVFAEQ